MTNFLNELNTRLYQSLYGDKPPEIKVNQNDDPTIRENIILKKVNLSSHVVDDYERLPFSENIFFKTFRESLAFIYKFSDIKQIVNTIYEKKKHGQKFQLIMSLGIVQMTVTSALYNPKLSLLFGFALAYNFINQKLSNTHDENNTKALMGAGILFFNYISPFIFDPSKNMFLFMSYLYFSLGAFTALTNTTEKTIFLSRITAITGFNAFSINDPLLYLGTLTMLSRGYLDDIIYENAPFSSIYLSSIKETSKRVRDEYLISITNVTANSFKSAIKIPQQIYKYVMERTSPARDFIIIKQG